MMKKGTLSSLFLWILFLVFNLVAINYLDIGINRIYYRFPWRPVAILLNFIFFIFLYLINRYAWFEWLKERLKEILGRYLLKTKSYRIISIYIFSFLILISLFLFRFWNIELIFEKRYQGIAQVFKPLLPKGKLLMSDTSIKLEGTLSDVIESDQILNTHKFSDYGRFLRTYRWHTVISQTERRYGIESSLLAGLIMQESMGNPLELNSGDDGGAGLMMFQPGTAREYGLMTYGKSKATGRDVSHGKELKNLVILNNSDYRALARLDERFHVEKSIDAGARFLSRLYSKHHSWDKAVSAYNRGTPAIAPTATKHVRQVRYFQHQYSFYLNKM